MAVVIVNEHEPHGEVAAKLLAMAAENGHAAELVVAQRGEHNAALSFRVPEDVAEQFDAQRGDLWPMVELEDDDNDPTTPPVRKSRPGKAKAEQE